MRFLVDECTGSKVAEWLRGENHEVFSVFDEARGITDDDILAKALTENRILITNDKDFGEMVFRERRAHHGVVQITTRGGEILFVGAEKFLKRLHVERGIPVVRRADVWSLIAEPFLILKFDDEHAERTLQTLEENGVSRTEAVYFRRLLEEDMIYHNNYYREASENDMREVLNVKFSKLLFSSWSRAKRDEFGEFYRQFMETALRAHTF